MARLRRGADDDPYAREYVVRERRGPVSRLLGGVAAFIGWSVLALIALIVLLIVIF